MEFPVFVPAEQQAEVEQAAAGLAAVGIAVAKKQAAPDLPAPVAAVAKAARPDLTISRTAGGHATAVLC